MVLDAAPHGSQKVRFLFWRPVFLRYMGGLSASILQLILLIMIGVEAIYLLELIVSHLLPHVLRYQAGSWNLIVLIGLSAPEAFFITLPIALLIGTYVVLLRRREAGEFIVLANMGQSIKPLIAMTLLFGVTAFWVSSAMSGIAEPQLRVLLGQRMFNIKHDIFRNGEITAGRFNDFGDFAVFAADGNFGRTARNVFILQDLGAEKHRLVVAQESTRIHGTNNADASTNRMSIVLGNANLYDFALTTTRLNRAEECAACAPQIIDPLSVRRAKNFLANGPDMQAPEPPGRERYEQFRTPELLRLNTTNPHVPRILAERFIRGLLCLIVPILALMGVALTRPKTALFVLPALCAFALSVSFFGPHLATSLAPLGVWPALGALGAGSILLMLGVLLVLHQIEAQCYQRQGVRF